MKMQVKFRNQKENSIIFEKLSTIPKIIEATNAPNIEPIPPTITTINEFKRTLESIFGYIEVIEQTAFQLLQS